MLVTNGIEDDDITEITAENCHVTLEQTAGHRVELVVQEGLASRRFRMTKQTRGVPVRMRLEANGPPESGTFARRDGDSDHEFITSAISPNCNLTVTREEPNRCTVVMTTPDADALNQQMDWEIRVVITSGPVQQIRISETPPR